VRLLGEGSRAAAGVISGPPGVGKTALAVHVAHLSRDRFPDGQVFVDLRATDARQPEPFDVLAWVLRSLGVAAGAVPLAPDERRDLFRTVIADRAVLFVLDDAFGEAQVRSLLPSGDACRALVTSRVGLPGLEGAHHVQLDILPAREAVELLGDVAGVERVAAEPAAASGIAELCDRLPLALRVAAARLASRPAWRLATLAPAGRRAPAPGRAHRGRPGGARVHPAHL
jgi:NB-ARC domain